MCVVKTLTAVIDKRKPPELDNIYILLLRYVVKLPMIVNHWALTVYMYQIHYDRPKLLYNYIILTEVGISMIHVVMFTNTHLTRAVFSQHAP